MTPSYYSMAWATSCARNFTCCRRPGSSLADCANCASTLLIWVLWGGLLITEGLAALYGAIGPRPLPSDYWLAWAAWLLGLVLAVALRLRLCVSAGIQDRVDDAEYELGELLSGGEQ